LAVSLYGIEEYNVTSEPQQQPAGTPIWTDLGSPDPAAATNFYSQLFGWESQDLGEEAGHYTFFKSDGKVVAAVGPLMGQGQPTVWTTYFATDDAEATARKVSQAGGQVLMPPMKVMDQGSMAIFTDSAGAAFAVWQPAKMLGAEKFNQPVSMSWNELSTRDVAAAKSFYPAVFGWGVNSNSMPDGGEYIEWQVGGKSVAGGAPMRDNVPAQVPSFWLVYFAVSDTDATVAKAQQLGGTLVSGPHDIPQGRLAVLTDAQGATFAVIQLSAAS
jgi:predicted enzyme related to lactoylglutathione lyase